MLSAQNFNPIIPDNVADPSVSKFGDTYYLYGTTDIDQGLSIAGAPVVWKSKDLVNWSFEGTLFDGLDWKKAYPYTNDKGEAKTGHFRYWAPGRAIERDGLYYLFPTIVKPDNNDRTYMWVSETPEGPFRFAEGEGLFAPGDNRADSPFVAPDIDGEIFIDDDNKAYMYWRRRKAAPLSADWSRIEGDEVNISTKRGGYSEGPAIFKRKGIYYYIYTLSGNQNYANAYMMSKEEPLGKYETPPSGNDIFIFSSIENNIWGPGHGNVFYDEATDQYFFFYLEYGEGGTTRQVYVNRIDFNEDGSIRTIVPDNKGVGYLAEPSEQRINLLHESGVKLTASSEKSPRSVEVSIETSPNNPLPDKGSVKEASRTFTYEAANAADGSNGTRWVASGDDESPFITADLGEVKKIEECKFFFNHPTEGHAWVLEKSTDGERWKVCARQDDIAVRSPHITPSIGKARYLRLKILKGSPGLWEWQVMQ